MTTSTYLQAPPQRKLIGLAAVVALHALLFWALQAGLASTLIQKMPTVVQALLLEEKRPERPPEPAPPLPPPPAQPVPPPTKPMPQPAPLPTATPPTPTTPPAQVPVAAVPALVAAPNAISAIAAVTAAPPPAAVTPSAPLASPPPAAPSTAPRAPQRSAAGVNMTLCEKPEYPSASRRMEEEGTVALRFLVGVDGKVLQSEIEKSSGFKRLDEAARNGLAKCQFKAAMVDGQAEQSWASIKYTWRLE